MGSQRAVTLERFNWEDNPDDKDVNFKREVALYTIDDPLPTVNRLSRDLDIPVGAVIQYVLCKWAASGSDALLEIGPDMVEKMSGILIKAEEADTDQARLKAYDSIRNIISWLRVPLDNPEYRSS